MAQNSDQATVFAFGENVWKNSELHWEFETKWESG